MLKPVGSLPSSVYWRRRLVLFVLLAVVVLVIALLVGRGGGSSQAAGPPSGASPTSQAGRPSSAGRAPSSPSRSRPRSTPVTACAAGALSVGAATGSPSYAVGAQPDLYLIVTNTGRVPCIANVSDQQVVLTVTTGDVRVWGSHDCAVSNQSATQTVLPRQPVRVKIVWAGTTSVPGCKAQRLQAQAGTYALTASLAGHASAAVPFSIT